MNKITLVAILFIVFSLSACTNPSPTPESTEVASVVAEVVVTNTAVSPTNTPSPSPTPSPTQTPQPTATATATITPTPSPIPSPTASFWQSDLAPANDDFQVVDQLGGRINTVTVKDRIAYVGVGPRLFLLDVSQPETPVELGRSDILPHLIERIAVVNNTAYVLTEDESGFWIVDVSQPSHPQIVSFFATAVPINFVREWNGRLYVGPSARDEDTLIFSVDNPLQPTLIGELPDKYSPIANDQYILSSSINNEEQITTILIADATDLNNIKIVEEISVDMPGYLIDIEQDRFYLLTFTPSYSFWVIEKHDGSYTTSQLKNLLLSPTFSSAYIKDNLLIFVENGGDVGPDVSWANAFDVTDPSFVRELNSLPLGSVSYDTFADDNIAYFASGERLTLAEMSKETGIQKLAVWSSLGDLVSIDADENQLFSLNSRDNRIYQLEIDDSQMLHLLYDHQSLQIDEVILMEDTIFTTGWFKGIHRFQTDTTPWQETAAFAPPPPNQIESVDQMLVQHDTLYARLDRDLGIFDISAPSEIKPIGQLDWETYSIGLFTVNQNTLYTWIEQGLKAISIAEPATPQEIGLLPDKLDSYLHDLAANDTHIYLLTGSCLDTNCNDRGRILQVVDISDPTNMTLVTQLPLMGDLTNIKLSGNNLLLTGEELWLVDITDPTQPQINGRFSTPGHAQDAVIVNDLIYIADGTGGILVLKLEE